VPFIGAEGEGIDRTVEGNARRQWRAMMVVEAAVLGGEGGVASGGGTAREPTAAAPAGRPGEEDDRVGRASWAGQMSRPSGGLAVVAQKAGRESGPAWVAGEAGHSWAESGAGPEFKRNSFQISIDF
jgi:hypothetical protein